MASGSELPNACHTKASSTCPGGSGWLLTPFLALKLKLSQQPCSVKACAQVATFGAHMESAHGLHYTVPTCRTHGSPSPSRSLSSGTANGERDEYECYELKPRTIGILTECNRTAALDKPNGTHAFLDELSMESFIEAYM